MTDPLTAWLKAVKTRLTKATPRPWISKWSGYRGVYDSRGLRIFDITTNTPDEDAQFIVHAPTDLARAVALVEAARTVVAAAMYLLSPSQNESPAEVCPQCGTFGVGELRDALTDWRAAVKQIPTP